MHAEPQPEPQPGVDVIAPRARGGAHRREWRALGARQLQWRSAADPWLLSALPGGPTAAMHEGYLQKKSSNYMGAFQRRWFVLKDGVLSYYPAQSHQANARQQFKIEDLKVVQCPDSSDFDLLLASGKTMRLRADSVQERNDWVARLWELNFPSLPDVAKEHASKVTGCEPGASQQREDALLDAIKRIRTTGINKKGVEKSITDPPAELGGEKQKTAWSAFWTKLGLEGKEEALAVSAKWKCVLSSPGMELVELIQMDEHKMREALLEDGDLGLTPEQQVMFCAVVEELRQADAKWHITNCDRQVDKIVRYHPLLALATKQRRAARAVLVPVPTRRS